jgi:DNA polymerase III delta prime subunit
MPRSFARKKAPTSIPGKGKPARRTTKAKVVAAVDNPFPVDPVHSERGRLILLYGPPGISKTTTAAHAPSPLFVCTHDEQGIWEAVTAGVVPDDLKNYVITLDPACNNEDIPVDTGHPGWVKLISTMDTFITGGHDRRTLVIDTTSGLQTLCFQHCASVLYKGDMLAKDGYMNYQEGYRKAAEQYWNAEFLSRCNLLTSAGYNVILLAHSKTFSEPNPGGDDYLCYTPSLHKGGKQDGIYEYTTKTCSAIMYMGTHTRAEAENAGRKPRPGQKKKVKTHYGFIGVRGEGWFVAKNWFNLRNDIDMGDNAAETWANLQEHINLK